MLLLPQSPKFDLFYGTADRFWATGHFDTRAPNDPYN